MYFHYSIWVAIALFTLLVVALSGKAFGQSRLAPAESMPPSQAASPQETSPSAINAPHTAFGEHHA
jgi:hypothetical protein